MGILKKLIPGKYTNRICEHYRVTDGGALEVDVRKLLSDPMVQKQLDAFQLLYMQETLGALYEGKEPPNSVGGYGILTKKKLITIWDDKWQAVLEEMNEHIDITYNSFFDIPEEHPPVTDFLTAEKIAEQYGKKTS